MVRLELLCVLALLGCRHRATDRDPPAETVVTPRATDALTEPGVIDLLPAFTLGDIDTAGPVIDLGEHQSEALLRGTAVLRSESVNGDSWAGVGARVRLRVPLSTSASPDATFEPPTSVRLRIRRSNARAVSVLVDGLLVRSAALPKDSEAHTITLPVPADRFRRTVCDIELRFIGPRPPPGAPPVPLVELDWVHLARADLAPTRVTDLINDVRVEPTARRALTLYAPTTLSTVLSMPAGARLTAAIAAEGPRGGAQTPPPVHARVRAEADGLPPVEWEADVPLNRPWIPISQDLSALGGRPVRLTVQASGAPDLRLAVANARLEFPPPPPETSVPPARRVVMVVVRGARLDRFLPSLSPNLRAGGFARIAREGVVSAAIATAPGELSALVSATTGLAADVHGVALPTDLLDEDAPTLASIVAAHGPTTRSYTDDAVWVGSGADRGFLTQTRCPNDAVTCRAEGMFRRAAEDLVAGGARPSLTVIVTRAGVMPLDPAPEQVSELDPTPYEGTLSSAQTGVLAQRTHRGPIVLEERDLTRMGLLYDASLLGVDRGIAYLFERLAAANMEHDTTVIVVGDRGTALGDGGLVGDGPMNLTAVSRTVFLAWGPGFSGRTLRGLVGVLDASASAIERLGAERAPEMEGRTLAGAVDISGRWLPLVANTRGDLGVVFGDRIGLPRAGLIGLFDLHDDPYGQTDLGPQEPISQLYAERALASLQGTEGRRRFQTSTRVLEPGVAAVHRGR